MEMVLRGATYNDQVSQSLSDIASAYGIELLVRFGSSVTGMTHARSDLDLAVLLRQAPSWEVQADLAAALQALFPGTQVDLAILNHADPLFLEQVTDGGVLLFGEPARWQEFRLYAFKRFQDHQRFLKMERDYVARAIASART
jgi:predicted nucleotidyltransferase